MPTATPHRDAVVASDLRVAVLRLARRIRAARVDTSLSLSQLSALAILDGYGPMTAGDLAALESVQPPTMTKVLATLVDREFVTRTAHPTDKRAVLLDVTPAGHDAVDAERRARDVWLTRELDRLGPADRDRVAELLPLLERIGVPDASAPDADAAAAPADRPAAGPAVGPAAGPAVGPVPA